MPDMATVEESDLEDMIAFLREKGGPVNLEVLVERYVTHLKERVMAAQEQSATQNATS